MKYNFFSIFGLMLSLPILCFSSPAHLGQEICLPKPGASRAARVALSCVGNQLFGQVPADLPISGRERVLYHGLKFLENEGMQLACDLKIGSKFSFAKLKKRGTKAAKNFGLSLGVRTAGAFRATGENMVREQLIQNILQQRNLTADRSRSLEVGCVTANALSTWLNFKQLKNYLKSFSRLKDSDSNIVAKMFSGALLSLYTVSLFQACYADTFDLCGWSVYFWNKNKYIRPYLRAKLCNLESKRIELTRQYNSAIRSSRSEIANPDELNEIEQQIKQLKPEIEAYYAMLRRISRPVKQTPVLATRAVRNNQQVVS